MRSIEEIMLPMTLGDLQSPKPPQFAFRIFVVGERRDFKFGGQVDHIKSRIKNDKPSLNGVWSRHMTHFKFLVPLKYLWNG